MFIVLLMIFMWFSPCFNNHLHHTFHLFNRRYSDCLYVHTRLHYQNNKEQPYVNAWSLVPYCRRPSDPLKNNMQKCRGQFIKFKDLREKNITVNHLFRWYASIDVLHDYQAFLDGEANVNGSLTGFCNCTMINTFGSNCEYHLNKITTDSFSTLAKNIMTGKKMSIACYRGPIANLCTYKKCFDWRNICNGLYDCEMGIDERLCLALEANTCDEDEYRCENGLCIPLSFAFDFVYDCRYRQKSCGDGQCLVSSKTVLDNKVGCLNNHTALVWMDIFSYDESLSLKCWEALVCPIFTFAGNIEVGKEIRCLSTCSLDMDEKRPACDRTILRECPEQPFTFPKPQPDIPFPPDIRLIYNRSEMNLNYRSIPKMICYNGTWCDGSFGNTEEVCETINEFGIKITNVSRYWDFHDMLRYLFALKCHPPSTEEVSFLLPISKLCALKIYA